MKRTLMWSCAAGALVALLVVVIPSHGARSERVTRNRMQGPPADTTCSEDTLNGNYGFQRIGSTIPGGALTALGIITFDGHGNTSGNQIISRNGVFSVQQLMPTYTVNGDCTGTLVDVSGTVIGSLVVVHNGSEVLGMSLTPGNNVEIHFERMFDPPGNAPPKAR